MTTSRLLLCAALTVLMVGGAVPEACSDSHSGDMLYLVHGRFIDPGVMIPMDQRLKMLNELVLPSLEMLAEWEKAGKIMGGLPVGAREGYLIMKAASNEKADHMLHKLPFWGLLEWKVTALGSFADRAALERTMVSEAMKKK